MTNDALDNPFWQYSLKVWEQPQVREALMMCQDKLDADINLVLFCMWCARQQLSIKEGTESCTRISSRWGETYLKPLRTLRGQSHVDGKQELKSTLLQAELLCEQFEQHELFEISAALQASSLSNLRLLRENLSSIGYAQIYDAFPKNLLEQLP